MVTRTNDEAVRIAAVTELTTDFTTAQQFENKSAGAATVRAIATADAFSQPSGNITFEDQLDFRVGNGLFRKLWVSSPSSTLASDGLGPLFNARSCQRCHLKDGRGHPPENGDDNSISMFLRVSIPAPTDAEIVEIQDYIATLPDPTYGTQMQDFAVQGHSSEYRLEITNEEERVTLADGTDVFLRHPTYTAANLGYGPLHPDAMLSPRVAHQMIGMGLLEAIPAADILAGADPEDQNDDGISGRPNVVWSVEFDQPMLGRFGLKAGNPTVIAQTAGAFAGDIGISNRCPLRARVNAPLPKRFVRTRSMAMAMIAAPKLTPRGWNWWHFTAAIWPCLQGAGRMNHRCFWASNCFMKRAARRATRQFRELPT